MQIARKEARQIILAFTAGAVLAQSNGQAIRSGTAACTPVNGDTCGGLQFSPRTWIMAESTLAAPAVVAPPLSAPPAVHQNEYGLFSKGPRSSGGLGVDAISLGFGLRARTTTAPT